VKKIVKKTAGILTAVLVIVMLIILSGAAVGYFYKDEIQNYIISEINSEIEVKVIVRSTEVSVFKKFPYVSVILNEVATLSGKDFIKTEFAGMETDTLFTASGIYLQFNLIDILRKNYRLRRVQAVDGKVNILTDSKGGINYRIFKENENSEEKSQFALELDGVKISGFSWQYLNISKDIFSEGEIKELALKGKFSQDSFTLSTQALLFVDIFSREGIKYASGLRLDTRLNLNVKDSVYTITRGVLSLNDLTFKTEGSFCSGKNTSLDFRVSGENLNIKSLVSAIPGISDFSSKYTPTGKAEILVKIIGDMSSTVAPSIKAAFKVSGGKLFIPDQGSYINGIALQGTYSNGTQRSAATSRLALSEYSVRYGENHLSGKLSIDNFKTPFLSVSLSGKVMAKDFSEFLNLDGLLLETGIINPDLSFNLNIGSFSTFKFQNISENGLNGNIVFKDISGKVPYTKAPLKLLEGNINMSGATWFPVFKMEIGKNKLSANLVVNHLWDYLVCNSKDPEVNGEILAGYFNVKDFLRDSDSEEETEFLMPDSLYLNLNCRIDSFLYGKFFASDLYTQFSYSPSVLTVSSLKMKTMNGVISGKAVITGEEQNNMLLRTTGELRKIDIYKLFYVFNDFGQDFLVAKNLKGFVSGTINFSAQISPKLELLTKNLTTESDFIIENGELINFEPINELSSFVELSELQHIKFSTLKNSVMIKDEKVFIPQMDINSSAFNITISGTHGFDNYFDYKVRLNLNEVLSRKAKLAKKENEEFGVVEDDGSGETNIYLSVIGTPDDFNVRYDRKEAMNKIKSNLQEEKKLLKTILKEELGLFRKDTASAAIKNPEKEQFIYDWEDEKDVQEVPVKTEKEKKAQKKDPDIRVTWDESTD